MALNIPNLDEIAKKTPKLAESLQRVQVYTTNNVAQAAGNAVVPPPVTQTKAPTSAPRAAPPPAGHVKALLE